MHPAAAVAAGGRDGGPEEGPRGGPIPLGATRPPMVPFVGLPFSAAIPLLFAGAEVQMAVGGLQGLAYAALLAAAVGAPLRAWVSHDWYAVEVLAAWARTSGPALDSARWGGASVSPFPLRPRHRRREPRGMTAP